MSKFWVLTVPWNLSFQAHALIHEIRTSRARGIDVPAEREPEARRIAVRMRWFAIGAHLVSAGIVALITFVSGGAIGYYLAALYLVSTFFRPAGAYFAYLRDRMTSIARRQASPRQGLARQGRRPCPSVRALPHPPHRQPGSHRRTEGLPQAGSR